jgi:hypothetical protein
MIEARRSLLLRRFQKISMQLIIGSLAEYTLSGQDLILLVRRITFKKSVDTSRLSPEYA